MISTCSLRNSSVICKEPSLHQPLSDNDDVNPVFVNRNPRNLEKMCIAQKPKGFILDYPSIKFWHKMFLNISPSHVTARVEHFTGKTVVSASTREWALRKHLYSAHDVCAAESVGRVIARRCLESGILHVHISLGETSSDKVKAFSKALEEEGLSLEEPSRIYPMRPWS